MASQMQYRTCLERFLTPYDQDEYEIIDDLEQLNFHLGGTLSSGRLANTRALALVANHLFENQPLLKVAETIALHKDYLPELESIHFEGFKWIGDGDFKQLFNAFPNLRTFSLQIDYCLDSIKDSFEGVRHVGIEHLLIQSSSDFEGLANWLSRCVFPNLHSLLVSLIYGYRNKYEYFTPMFDSFFENLTELSFYGAHQTDDLVCSLAASKLFQQIRLLDLSWGRLTDDGIDVIINRPPAELNELIMLNHFVSEKCIQQIVKLPISITHTPEMNADRQSRIAIQRLERRVKVTIDQPFRLAVGSDCLPNLDPSVLDQVLTEGLVRFQQSSFPGADDSSRVLTNPTWKDVLIEANQQSIETGMPGPVLNSVKPLSLDGDIQNWELDFFWW